MRTRLTPEQRRARNRLRSLRWRRAHGIGPRKPAERPWLAMGAATAAKEAVLDRLAWQIAELRASLDRCAGAHAAMGAELN